ncbi:NusB/RsmB/TIM44 [Anaeromyxobacter dehalogenans 2CP-1]|uniref:NusB/RsmB/TIM44 n=1 Tax=Anaeromyxobacter dehalogenans (strain ATCC BAA-258 / DSM 21875 / 2CP-1) TaxID=455488 RepID=B8J9P4_ANAD2|nr:transcription antitermination factor NusB [Anaeromyxobacter dehalogenans]ACL67432.1 NusB/RsmB/TIM44 [Anaeromyxobacter dehalogenans 2CP-1]
MAGRPTNPAAGARGIAFDVLRRVEEGGAYASRALDAALGAAGALDPREAGLATELVYGTLRRALALDAALAPHSRRALAELDPAARVALRLGAYQLLVLGTPAHAAVGETVALAKAVDHGRAAGYVNAVLRSLSRAARFPDPPALEADPAGHVAAAEALPRWVAEEWVGWLGAGEALALARAMNAPAPLCVRTPDREALLARARAAGLAAAPAARAPGGVVLTGASVGELARAAGGVPFQVQDEAAQLVTLLAAGDLAGRPARVLDACAAPGGKAFHLAELLGPGAEVVAIELHPRKADELAREAARRGLPAVRVVCADAGKPIPGLEPGSFDAVLVDAPCAGLGTLRRHPELKLRRAPGDLPRMAALQRKIALNAARYARPGAPVVYSICSLSRAEGPEVVETLLGEGFRRAPPPAGFPADVLDARGDLLTLPSRHGTDGFYAARLVRDVPSTD